MKKIYVIFLVLILALAMVLPNGVANAGSGQIDVNGTFTLYTTGMDNVRFVGNHVIMLDFVHTIYYEGSFDGEATEIMHSIKNMNSGAFNSVGIQEFNTNATFMGQPGTFTAQVRHQGGMDDIAKVEMTIISGTDACENLHGTLIFMANPVYNGDPYPQYYTGIYSGKLHFAP